MQINTPILQKEVVGGRCDAESLESGKTRAVCSFVVITHCIDSFRHYEGCLPNPLVRGKMHS